MGKSFRVTIRFNPEYDTYTIQKIKSIKGSRQLSKILRKIIRDGLKDDIIDHALSDNKITEKFKLNIASDFKEKNQKKEDKKERIVKWNFP